MSLSKWATAVALAIGTAGSAGAVVIDPGSWGPANCDGATSCSITQGDTTVTITSQPTGSLIDVQNFAGISGLGVQFITTGQSRDPEIQGDQNSTEGLTFQFDPAQIITEIRLAHFYNPQQYGSDPQEVALFSGSLLGSIQVLNNSGGNILTGALLGGTASLVNVSQGLWSINTAGSQLGSTYINTLTFRAANTPLGQDNSDFSVASVTAVPEPATLALLGTGLIGLGAILRRRRDA